MRQHYRNSWPLLAGLIMVVCLGLLLPVSASAQVKTLRWLRWDVDVRISSDGSFDVREEREVLFTNGVFTYGFADIEQNQFVELNNVRVSEPGVPYTASSSQEPFNYSLGVTDDLYQITWYYPPTENASRVFIIEYTIYGGLIINEEVGDRFFWEVIHEHDQAIDSSVIRVFMPPGAQVDTTIEPAIFGANGTYEIIEDGTAVRFAFSDVQPNQTVEVGVRFPHGFVPAEPPPWQAAYEREQAWNDTYKPIANLGGLALSTLVLVGGLLGVFGLWFLRGRDPAAGPVPSALTQPPSDLAPGLAGTLLDERADLQDIMATVIDLARRGFINMEEKQRTTFGIAAGKGLVFHRVAGAAGELLPFEKHVLDSLFKGRSKDRVELKDLQERFYSSVPGIETDLYEAAVKAGFFTLNPQKVRTRYSAAGLALLVASFAALILLVLSGAMVWVESLVCLPGALFVIGLVLMIAAGRMPAKTQLGAEEAAKWKAFKAYLQEIERHTQLSEAGDQFEKYLPYAIAFGLEHSWIAKFAKEPATPVPPWFFPVGRPYLPGRPDQMRGPVLAGSPGSLGEAAGGAPPRPGPSLQGMSDSLGGSLNSMSGSLTNMLNTTARALNTAPPSSSSSGGGGFSGGGFSGGGFSGGGGGGGGRSGFG